MSSADAFEIHIHDVIHRAINGISPDDAAQTYAMSFWVYADQDDPRRQVADFNYNTTSNAKSSEDDAADADEATWN